MFLTLSKKNKINKYGYICYLENKIVVVKRIKLPKMEVYGEKIYINSRNLTITETLVLLLACNAIVKIVFGVEAELEVK